MSRKDDKKVTKVTKEQAKEQIIFLNVEKAEKIIARKAIDKTDRKARKVAQIEIDKVRDAITLLIRYYNSGRKPSGSRIFANRDKTDFRTSALHFRD